MPGQHLQRPRASKAHENNIVVASAQRERDHWSWKEETTDHINWPPIVMSPCHAIHHQMVIHRWTKWVLPLLGAAPQESFFVRCNLDSTITTSTSSHPASSQPSSKNNNNKTLLISTLILLLLVPWIDYLTIHWQTRVHWSKEEDRGRRATCDSWVTCLFLDLSSLDCSCGCCPF